MQVESTSTYTQKIMYIAFKWQIFTEIFALIASSLLKI